MLEKYSFYSDESTEPIGENRVCRSGARRCTTPSVCAGAEPGAAAGETQLP